VLIYMRLTNLDHMTVSCVTQICAISTLGLYQW
jgi:hypothetical protein